MEVDRAWSRIVEYPLAWPALSDDFRRCLLGRFPYGIVYSFEADGILVASIMNLHRHPDSWRMKDLTR